MIQNEELTMLINCIHEKLFLVLYIRNMDNHLAWLKSRRIMPLCLKFGIQVAKEDQLVDQDYLQVFVKTKLEYFRLQTESYNNDIKAKAEEGEGSMANDDRSFANTLLDSELDSPHSTKKQSRIRKKHMLLTM